MASSPLTCLALLNSISSPLISLTMLNSTSVVVSPVISVLFQVWYQGCCSARERENRDLFCIWSQKDTICCHSKQPAGLLCAQTNVFLRFLFWEFALQLHEFILGAQFPAYVFLCMSVRCPYGLWQFLHLLLHKIATFFGIIVCGQKYVSAYYIHKYTWHLSCINVWNQTCEWVTGEKNHSGDDVFIASWRWYVS